jgi:hypothetical protein
VTRARRLALAMCLLLAAAARAQDALVAGANLDHLRGGDGGGASLTWIHPRGHDTFSAGATFLSLPGTRWTFATFGDVRTINARTVVNVEANAGGGRDDRGSFRYLLFRGGVTRELLPKRLYAEGEWLQIDIARQQDGIARAGVTWLPSAPLALRASLFQSVFGDSDTTLATLRGDYDFGRVTAIGGGTAGTAIPALLQQQGARGARIREAFGGVAFGGAARRWTLIASSLSVGGERRQRLTMSCRVPLPWRGSRKR